MTDQGCARFTEKHQIKVLWSQLANNMRARIYESGFSPCISKHSQGLMEMAERCDTTLYVEMSAVTVLEPQGIFALLTKAHPI